MLPKTKDTVRAQWSGKMRVISTIFAARLFRCMLLEYIAIVSCPPELREGRFIYDVICSESALAHQVFPLVADSLEIKDGKPILYESYAGILIRSSPICLAAQCGNIDAFVFLL